MSALNLQEIPRVSKITKEEFLKNYFKPQKPLVIKSFIEDWPAYSKWNLEYMAEIARLFSTLNVALGAVDLDPDRAMRKLMTVQERNQYREQLRHMESDEDREKFQAQHREQMEQRAKALQRDIEEAE